MFGGMTWNDITEKTRLPDLVEKVDFQSPTKKQGQNFDHFIDFLNKNSLDHIYKDNVTPEVVPLDEKLKEVDFKQPVVPISGCTTEEIAERFESYSSMMEKKNANKLAAKDKVIKNLQADVKKKDKKIKHQKGTLNRKSVRIALKTANMLSTK